MAVTIMAKSALFKTITGIVVATTLTLSVAAGAVMIQAMKKSNSVGDSQVADGDAAKSKSIDRIELTNTYGLIDEYTIYYTDDSTSVFIVTNGASGAQGIQGFPGLDGHTPVITIGDNGNWVVDGVDTGTFAQGRQGEAGVTPHIGADGHWYIGEIDTGVIAEGHNGKTPIIGANGNWWIGGTDTGVAAQGATGRGIESIEKTDSQGLVDVYTITYTDGTTSTFLVTNGADGAQGQGIPGQGGYTPEITIDATSGNWVVDGVDTGVHAEGPQGVSGTSVYAGNGNPTTGNVQGNVGDTYIDLSTGDIYNKGQDGWGEPIAQGGLTSPHIGTNGNWYIGDTDTGIHAQGPAGASIYTGSGDPTTGNVQGSAGDSYIDLSTGDVYHMNENGEWGNPDADSSLAIPHIGTNGHWYVGQTDTGVDATGPQGPAGTSVLIGHGDPTTGSVTGREGDTYIDLTTGYYYTMGENNEWGNPTGEGAIGTSLRTGTVEPTADIGNNGDSYINTDTWDYYVKENGTWVLKGNFAGQNGTNGVSITQVEKTSTDGLVDTYTITYSDNTQENPHVDTFTVTNGKDGNKIIVGTGAPTDETLANVGDNYIDVEAWKLYVKAEDSWTDKGSFRGQDGVSIVSVAYKESNALVDVYEITYSDSTQETPHVDTFTVTNGKDGTSVRTGHRDPRAVEDDPTTAEDETLAAVVGIEGDSYIDLDTWNFFVLYDDGEGNLLWTPEGNLHYSPNRYVVTFDSNGGSAVDPYEEALEGFTIQNPTAPTQDGYFFQGWYTAEGTRWDFSKDVVTQDITLTARWGQFIIEDGILTHCSITEGDIVIPEFYDNQLVVGIGDEAFKDKEGITSFVIPHTVKTIGAGAFENCTGLTSVVIPSNVKSIGEGAFVNCYNVVYVYIEEGAANPGISPFFRGEGQIKGLETIGEYAFAGCDSLVGIVLPKTVITVGKGAFAGCDSLTSYTGGLYFNPDYEITLSSGNGEPSASNPTNVYLDLDTGDFYVKPNGVWEFYMDVPVLIEDYFALGHGYPTVSTDDYDDYLDLDSGLYYYVDDVENKWVLGGNILTEDFFGFADALAPSAYFGYLFGADSSEDNQNAVPQTLETVIINNDVDIGESAFKNCSSIKFLALDGDPDNIATAAFAGCTNIETLRISSLKASTGTFFHYVPNNESFDSVFEKALVGDYIITFDSNFLIKIDENNYAPINLLDLVDVRRYESYEDPSIYGYYEAGTIYTNTTTNTTVVYLDNPGYYVIGSQLTGVIHGSGHPSTGAPGASNYTYYWDDDNNVLYYKWYSNWLTFAYYYDYDSSDDALIYRDLDGNYSDSDMYSLTTDEDGNDAYYIDADNNIFYLEQKRWVSFDRVETLTDDIEFNGSTPTNVLYFDYRTGQFYNALAGSNRPVFGIQFVEETCLGALFGNSTNALPSSVETVILNDSFETIGDGWFKDCLNVKTFVLPNTLKSIGNGAFENCANLTSIVIPDSVETIGEYAFYDCASLQYATLPSGLTKISNGMFAYCTSLNYIPMNDLITEIGEEAFMGCDSFVNVAIPSQIETIGLGAFKDCNNIQAMVLPFVGGSRDDNTYLGYIFGNMYDPDDYIPTGLTHIVLTGGSGSNRDTVPNNAFYECEYLEHVEIPNSIKTIESGAFCYCTSLETIVLPKGVTEIQNSAFSDCTSLKSINLEEGLETIGYYAFKGCTSLTTLVVPKSVTSISGDAFSNMTNLRYLTIPFIGRDPESSYRMSYVLRSVNDGTSTSELTIYVSSGNGHNRDTIYGSAFYDLNFLTTLNVVLSDDIKYIQQSAFGGCSYLKSVVLPGNLATIGNSAFWNCSSLTYVAVPDSVYEIGTYAFYGCTSLKAAKISLGLTQIPESAFLGCTSLASVTLHENITRINKDAFRSCSSIVAINLPEALTLIGETAFAGCTNLQFVNIPNNLQTLGKNAFSGCSSLESIVIPDGITTIGYGPFKGCTGLKTMTLPFVGVTRDYNSKLLDLFRDGSSYSGELPPQLETIILTGGNASNTGTDNACVGIGTVPTLKTLVIPNGVTLVGGLSGCVALESITLPESIRIINDRAFKDCTNLKYIYNSDLVEQIGDESFRGCTSLEAISLTGVKRIGENAFRGDTLLAYISFGTPDSFFMDKYALQDCSSLKRLILPKNASLNADSLLAGCTSLEALSIPFVGKGDATSGTLTYALAYTFGNVSGSQANINLYSSLKIVEISRGNFADRIIPQAAFQYAKHIETIILADEITAIGRYAFQYCDSLKTINMPASLKTIGDSAFAGYNKIESFDIPETVTSIGAGAFRSKIVNEFTEYTYAGNFSHGDGTPNVDHSVAPFDSDGNDGDVYVEENNYLSVSFATAVFYEKQNGHWTRCFECIQIDGEPDENTNEYLTYSYVYSTSLHKIYRVSFVESSLKSISLPFVGGSKTDETKQSLSYIFDGYTNSSFASNNAAIPASLKTVIIKGTNSNGAIPASSFAQAQNIETIVLPNDTLMIGNYAFAYCNSLKNVNIPESIQSIGVHAFDSCRLLETISIGEHATYIGEYAFANCTGIKTMIVRGIEADIQNNAFIGCNSIELLSIAGFGATLSFNNVHDLGFGDADIDYLNSGVEWDLNPAGNIFLNTDHSNIVITNWEPDELGYHSDEGQLGKIYVCFPYNTHVSAFVVTWNGSEFVEYDGEPVVQLPVVKDGVWYIGDQETGYANPEGEPYYILTTSNDPSDETDGYAALRFCGVNTDTGRIYFVDTAGHSNDLYLNTVTGMLYKKVNGLWSELYVVPEAVGLGAQAVTIGSGAPSTHDDDDYYVDKFTANFYHYDSGSWALVTNFVSKPKVLADWFNNSVPESIKTVALTGDVTSIPANALYGCEHIERVILPDTIENIGNYAFYHCSSLVEINLPASLVTVGNYAFDSVNAFDSLVFSASVTSIGQYAFANCTNIQSVTFLNDRCTVGSKAFANDLNVQSLQVPYVSGYYTSISDLFDGIPNNLRLISVSYLTADEIPNNMFANCKDAESIALPQGYIIIGDNAFNGCNSLRSINMPSTVITIGVAAFKDCYALNDVTLPAGLTEIGNSAFENCDSFTKVTLAATISWIGYDAFKGCDSLRNVKLIREESMNVTMGSGVFEDCSGLLVADLREAEFGYMMPTDMFKNCISLKTVYFNDGTDFIAESTFEGCISLTAIQLPVHLVQIGDSAFKDCISLTALYFPNSVSTIGESAFEHCVNLTTIRVHSNLTNYGDNAFLDCHMLSVITYSRLNSSANSWANYVDDPNINKTGNTALLKKSGGTFIIRDEY